MPIPVPARPSRSRALAASCSSSCSPAAAEALQLEKGLFAVCPYNIHEQCLTLHLEGGAKATLARPGLPGGERASLFPAPCLPERRGCGHAGRRRHRTRGCISLETLPCPVGMPMSAHRHTRTWGRARSRRSQRGQPARARRTRTASLALGRRGHRHDLRTALKSRTPLLHTRPAPDGARPAPRACSCGLLRKLTAKPHVVQGIEFTSQQGGTDAGHTPTDGRAKRRRRRRP